MDRRKFFKLMATGATPLAISMLCNLPLETLVSSPTAKPTFKPTRLPPSATLTETVVPPSATPTIGPVPTPHSGLGSKNNYFLYSDCNPVTGLSVTIDITKDITSDIGFSFQLNAYSPEGANCVWQQYGFTFHTANHSPLQVHAFVDNWPSADFTQAQGLGKGNLINHYASMLTLPTDTLSAGYKFTIALKYDQDENVKGATFTILDTAGKSTNLDVELESLTYAKSTGKTSPITSADLAPINSFVLVLVGPDNDQRSNLSSGAGKFTYIASSPLKVSSKDPGCTSAQKITTAETANSMYGTLFAGPSKIFTQTFDTVK